jgi:N-acetylmuramoyl-L-alanine amidase
MRTACRTMLVVLLSGLILPLLAAPSAKRPNIRYVEQDGTKYLYLRDIATFYGMRYSPGTKGAVLSSKYSKLVFSFQCREFEFNGVKMFGAFPLRKNKNEYLLAALDLSKIIDPVLRISTLPRRRVRRIVIDPGHGGKDVGAICGSHREKDINLQVALRLGKKLQQHGYQVSYTRSDDSFVGLAARPQVATRVKADLFISLHCNSAGASVSGIETFTATAQHTPATGATKIEKNACAADQYSKENAYFSFYVQKKLLEKTKATDRGVRRRRFLVIRELRCPGVLIEMGFISNSAERTRLLQSSRQEEIADAIVEAVNLYRNSSAPRQPSK